MPVELWCPEKRKRFTARSATWEEVAKRKLKCPVCGQVHSAQRAPIESREMLRSVWSWEPRGDRRFGGILVLTSSTLYYHNELGKGKGRDLARTLEQGTPPKKVLQAVDRPCCVPVTGIREASLLGSDRKMEVASEWDGAPSLSILRAPSEILNELLPALGEATDGRIEETVYTGGEAIQMPLIYMVLVLILGAVCYLAVPDAEPGNLVSKLLYVVGRTGIIVFVSLAALGFGLWGVRRLENRPVKKVLTVDS